jgi:hypothetical protein
MQTRATRLWVFQNAGHNSWPTTPDAAWWAEVLDWLSGQG